MERRLKSHLPEGKFVGVSIHRARIMSAIRGKSNRTTELRLRMALVRSGIEGWTLHSSALPGKPDFCFPKSRVAVFVDGCFWHGCDRCGHVPKTRSAFWQAKFERNQERDPRYEPETARPWIYGRPAVGARLKDRRHDQTRSCLRHASSKESLRSQNRDKIVQGGECHFRSRPGTQFTITSYRR